MSLLSDASKDDSPALRAIVEDTRRRLKENPADIGAVLKLADALVRSDRKTEAVRVLNRYGPIVQSRGRLEAAIAIYKKAWQLDPDYELTSSTFLSHVQLKNILEAEKAAWAEAPPVPAPPPSGFFTRPGPDPPPASGSFPLAEAITGPPFSGSFLLPEPAPPSSEWRQKREIVHGATPGIPLLRDIPPFLIDLVLQRINLIALGPGEILFREGSEGNSVFFVVQGALEVTARNELGEEVVLRMARDGEAIGEASFLTGLPRYSTVTAREHSHLLELDHAALTPIALKHRPLADALGRLYEKRVLTSALARSRVFGVLSEAERRHLTQRLRTVVTPAGTLAVRQGAPAKGAYIVKRGAFRVTYRSGDREVVVALVRPHEVVGDLAEGGELPQAESVTAMTDSELLFLAPEDLAALRSRNPQLETALDALRLERAERCVAALRAIRR